MAALEHHLPAPLRGSQAAHLPLAAGPAARGRQHTPGRQPGARAGGGGGGGGGARRALCRPDAGGGGGEGRQQEDSSNAAQRRHHPAAAATPSSLRSGLLPPALLPKTLPAPPPPLAAGPWRHAHHQRPTHAAGVGSGWAGGWVGGFGVLEQAACVFCVAYNPAGPPAFSLPAAEPSRDPPRPCHPPLTTSHLLSAVCPPRLSPPHTHTHHHHQPTNSCPPSSRSLPTGAPHLELPTVLCAELSDSLHCHPPHRRGQGKIRTLHLLCWLCACCACSATASCSTARHPTGGVKASRQAGSLLFCLPFVTLAPLPASLLPRCIAGQGSRGTLCAPHSGPILLPTLPPPCPPADAAASAVQPKRRRSGPRGGAAAAPDRVAGAQPARLRG